MDIPDQPAKAAQGGDAAAVARLLAGGAEADARNAARRTPLELAVREGRGGDRPAAPQGSPEDEAVYRSLFNALHAAPYPEWPKA
ncbi:hypothetical protein ACE1OC_16870 [Streptomyces sp. DSM 116496]|uniref:hypothetical protein n=1 Tax=Streptomyces stoeckheimensis TaxID=3344656 RepID=UPI0038B2DB57